ncbi:Integrase, catalytic core domain and Ribonuclease H-like domain-containing protein [Strongyloides ratti]|uniref:Integrase, catalytic core domain and Ribonuclease H-like domain-containing protein n=1 Tax=Strongyloides ratti TaxID=34506 RepID=A0A090KVL3_STRRB|nr:Integrase, catalytic core domain and Ribonuclease H-like domain-containing protein [Strongyloides ratti]CEF61550.1 Integrase, catalytic core domain and Ribonuclease H-like domain-containing protein [Strongyloides ratti]
MVYKIDLCGPFSKTLSSNGNQYILLLTDTFSRYWMSEAITDSKTSTILEAILQLCYKYEFPKKFKLDNATYFNNQAFDTMTKIHGIELIFGQPYNHTSQSIVERSFRTLQDIISKIIENPVEPRLRQWDLCLQQACYFYNASPQLTTEYSPYELFFEGKPYLNLDIIDFAEINLIDRDKIFEEQLYKTQLSYAKAHSVLLKHRLAAVEKNNTPVLNSTNFKPGDLFLVKEIIRESKFDVYWEGSYKVIDSDSYVIKYSKPR